MLAPAAWLIHELSKERKFLPRAEILAEMLRAIGPGKRGAPAALGSGLISKKVVTATAAGGWEEAQVIRNQLGHGSG
jgi:hypothetical protein